MQQKYKVFKCSMLIGVCFFLGNASFGMDGTSYADYIKMLETGSKPSQEEIAGIFGHSENQKTEKLSKSLKNIDLKDSDSNNPLMERVLEEKARRELPDRTLNPSADYIKKLETGSKPSREEIAGIFGHSENQKTEKLSKSLKNIDLKDSDSNNPLMERVLEEKARRELPDRTLNPRDADYIKKLETGSKVSKEEIAKVFGH